MRTLFFLIAMLSIAVSNAQMQSRLLRAESISNDGQYAAEYKYSPGRGGTDSIYNLSFLRFDTSYSNTVYKGNTIQKYMMAQTFDFDGNLVSLCTIGSDTTIRQFTYENDRLVGENYRGSKGNQYLTSYSYNKSGLLEDITTINVLSSRGNNRQMFSYNNDRQLIETTGLVYDSFNRSWIATSKSINAYSGDLLVTVYGVVLNRESSDTIQRIGYSYDGSKRLISKKTFWIAGGEIKNWRNDSTVYDANGDVVLYYRCSYSLSTGGFANTELDSNGYDDKHNCVYSREQSNIPTGILTNYAYATTDYNSYDQPVLVKRYSWNKTAGSWVAHTAGSHTEKYFYEEYTPRWNSHSNNFSILIYPSPANGFIYFRVNLAVLQPYTASIVDMQGRVLRKWSESNGGNAIPVGDLPNGNYLLRLSSELGKGVQKFTIER